MENSTSNGIVDVERDVGKDAHLANHTVHSLAWEGIQVSLHHRFLSDLQPKPIISDVDGIANAGDLVAIMGPSGSGKTTMLNVLAHRNASFQAEISGSIKINGSQVSTDVFQSISSYVEQEDALIGSLTVRETLDFAARLSLPRSISTSKRLCRVDELLSSFGLQQQAHTLVGTPIRKGISGGQKRRLSIASQLITAPKILFLDEPTSGLDSTASFEVIKFLRSIVKKHKLIVLASIHQPSTTTFELFDKLLLLASGQVCFNGPVPSIKPYLDSIDTPMPTYINPAEFLLDLTSSDFAQGDEEASLRIEKLHSRWRGSSEAKSITAAISALSVEKDGFGQKIEPGSRSPFFGIVLALLHRSFIKSYRDVVAYGIRFAMYIGLAIMMGTVWLRLAPIQSSIQPFTNAIFFGSAFMSFMAVAYVPAFLEDRATFIKERSNGLYGATAFMMANFLIGLPYLFLISLIFSIIAYWLSNFRPGADAFFTWVMWLFLDLLAGESLVVLVSSLFPNFVVALALTAFANGLWMSVGGFLVSPTILNPFWRYVFHYIDYQAYVFRGMMVNEFGYRNYACGSGCQCMYQTSLAPECMIDGQGVLALYGYRIGDEGKWVGIMLGILMGYRLLGWGVSCLRKS